MVVVVGYDLSAHECSCCEALCHLWVPWHKHHVEGVIWPEGKVLWVVENFDQVLLVRRLTPQNRSSKKAAALRLV